MKTKNENCKKKKLLEGKVFFLGGGGFGWRFVEESSRRLCLLKKKKKKKRVLVVLVPFRRGQLEIFGRGTTNHGGKKKKHANYSWQSFFFFSIFPYCHFSLSGKVVISLTYFFASFFSLSPQRRKKNSLGENKKNYRQGKPCIQS
jgi:hypothetical protein